MRRDTVRIGCGAGFSGDRLEPALLLAEHAGLDYLALECLGERTVALAQLRRRHDPEAGYDPMLERRMAGLLPLIAAKKVTLITNMGAANPEAAAQATVDIARRAGLRVRVAAVTGDDVLSKLDLDDPTIETGATLRSVGALVSANAYLGIDALLPALEGGAAVIITGRVADPSLFLAPIVHHFGWPLDDHDRLGRGTMVGHLLECGGQLTGGYYADPGCKDVPGMASLGFPFADVDADGNARFAKLPGTGGVISRRTATEQLLYEVTDPSAYKTPDVVADFSGVTLREAGENVVAASGARGKPRPGSLKVSVGYHAGYVGEGEIGYAGENCVARGTLAGEIVRERLGNQFRELRIDLTGLTALHSRPMSNGAHHPYEVRLRVAGRAADEETAGRVGEEVEALYTNGPAGGGGARKSVHEQIGIVSCLMPRERVAPRVTFFEA